jgi:hypothetical protein
MRKPPGPGVATQVRLAQPALRRKLGAAAVRTVKGHGYALGELAS